MNLIKINRDLLLNPLQAVSGIIERRHTLPILSNVLLLLSPERLQFVATDIEIEITASVSTTASSLTKGLTIAARKFLDILRSLPEGTEVSLAMLDKRLQLKAGKSRFSLQTLPSEDFPRLADSEEPPTRFVVSQKLLKDLIALVQYAMAQQDIRYYLNGLLMIIEDGTLKLIATDGHRLAYASNTVADPNIPRQEVILPRKTVIELSKLLGEKEEDVLIELSASQARFKFGDVRLVSKLVDGKFPDYTRVIPQNQPRKLRLNRSQLLQSLQRAAILTSEKFRGVRWVFSTDSLKVVCSNTEQEEAQDELDVAYSGEPLEIGFNVGYLLDVLNNVDVPELDFALGDSNSSALITIPDRDQFKYVVMPMRI